MVYADLEEALAARALDAVVLCSPNHLHAAQAIAATTAGCHVLVEKPLANTVAEADAMIRAASQHRVVLMVAQCRRFTKAALQARMAKAQSELTEGKYVHTIAKPGTKTPQPAGSAERTPASGYRPHRKTARRRPH
jgi:predicted dehydrogenase